jgi:WD40 repeat protein
MAVVAEVGRVADTGWATSLDFHPSGEFVAAAFQDFGLEIWSLPTRSRAATLEGAFGVISDVRWSSNGRFLMVTTHTPQIVRVYSSETWQLVGELQAHGHETVRRGIGVNAASIASDATVLLVPQGERGIDVFELGD